MKYFKLFEDWDAELIESLLLEGSSAATTFYHEVVSGLALIGKVTKYEDVYKDGENQLDKYFKNGDIQALGPNLTVVNLSAKQLKFTSGDTPIPNKAVVDDAIASGQSIKKRFDTENIQPTNVYWSGPTNDTTEYGAADIISSPTNDVKTDGTGVSLKYKKGQLKNLTAEQLFQTVLPKRGKGGDHNFLDWIWDFNQGAVDKMTISWMVLLTDEIKKTKNQLAIDAWEPILKAVKTWKQYQSTTLNDDQIKALSTILSDKELKDITKLKKLTYFGKKLYETKKIDTKWLPIRTKYFSEFFGKFLESQKEAITENLGVLLGKQLSVSKKRLWYSANGGTDIKIIPGQEDFDNIVSALDISFTHNESKSGYHFVLHIKTIPDKSAGIKKVVNIGKIIITIRWKDGQMRGKPNTSSTSKWLVQGEDWQKIFT